MSSESDQYAVLVEALEAGGYAPAAISNAKVAANRGLGKRTTQDLVAAADPAAGKIAAAIFGSQETRRTPESEMTLEEGVAEMDRQLAEALGFRVELGGDE